MMSETRAAGPDNPMAAQHTPAVGGDADGRGAVSYTHLTLPTKLEV